MDAQQRGQHKPHVKVKSRRAAQPFWQADKPYLRSSLVLSDAKFRRLSYVMTFVAGAINAGGFFAVASYTSHITGALSHAADMVYTGNWEVVVISLVGVLCFILGAAHSSWTIMWAKRQRFRSGYGLSMWLEGIYLLVFALMGAFLAEFRAVFVPSTLMLLCFIMGMHNTVMSLLSGGAVRSTHMTGTGTDLGIELAKVLYYRHDNNPRLPDVRVNRPKMVMLSMMMVLFILGGFVGAWGYHEVSYYFTLPVAVVLFVFGFSSVGYDVKLRAKIWLRHRRMVGKEPEDEKDAAV